MASPEEVERAAEAWLLAAPALIESELRARGHDPDDPELICLERDERRQWPAFQFDEHGGVHEIVRTINRRLSPPDDPDPWGAADWWLGQHGALEGDLAPVQLISQDSDLLLRLAAAESSR